MQRIWQDALKAIYLLDPHTIEDSFLGCILFCDAEIYIT